MMSIEDERALIRACRSRVLTDDEMETLLDEGPDIMFCEVNPSRDEVRAKMFNDLCLMQFRMRIEERRLDK